MLMLFIASLVTATLLLAEHILFWETNLKRTEAYTLGVATIGVGFTLWSIRPEEIHPAVAFWVIAGVGGFTVVSAYWCREHLAQIRSRARAAGEAAGPESPAVESEAQLGTVE